MFSAGVLPKLEGEPKGLKMKSSIATNGDWIEWWEDNNNNIKKESFNVAKNTSNYLALQG